MSIIKNYLKTTIRYLVRQKYYTMINILRLTIGFLCCLFIYIIMGYHLSFDRFHKNRDNIYRTILDANIEGIGALQHCGSFEWMGRILKQDYPEIKDFVRLYGINGATPVKYNDNISQVYSFYFTDPSFFQFFDFDFLYGNAQNAFKNPNSLILSKQLSEKIFGRENPVGKSITIAENNSYIISAVLKEIPNTSHLQINMLAPFPKSWLLEKQKSEKEKIDAGFYTYVMLESNIDPKSVDKKIAGICNKYHPDMEIDVYLQSLKDMHLYSGKLEFDQINWKKFDIVFVYVLSFIAILILVIACINYINLTTARSLRRSKEVGIRKMIGAHRKQLTIQFISESVVTSFISMILAALIFAIISQTNNTFNNEFSFYHNNKLLIYMVMAILSGLTGILAGIYPALSMSLPQPLSVFNSSKDKKKGKSLQKILVTAQFCISIILIICTLFIEKQLNWIQNKDLGFDKTQVVTVKMPETVQKNLTAIKHELLSNTLIKNVSAFGPNNFPGFEGQTFQFEGQIPDQSWITSLTAVDYNFLEFFNLKLVEGRDFSPLMQTDVKDAYIINETLKKKLGWETAVGKSFWVPAFMEKPGKIIGVVKDFHTESLHHKIDAFTIFLKPKSLNWMTIRVAPDKTNEALELLNEKWKQFAPSSSLEYRFLDQIYAYQYGGEQAIRKVVNTFTTLAIFIACLGLLGLISYSTEQRTKEIGVRKVLGASVLQIFYMISKEFIFLLSLAAIFAAPIAWYFVQNWLQHFAYRIDLTIWPFLLAGFSALLIALLTISFQTIRAATANPVESLRYE